MSVLTSDVESRILERWNSNPMLKPYIAKVTVNIGVGADSERLPKAMKVLEELTGQQPAPRRAKKTIKDFGIKKGDKIAAVVTLRGEKAHEFLRKVFETVGYRVKASSFDDYGNVSIGIKEHIHMPGVRYDPEIGVFGMDVAITIERPGYRVMRRRRMRSRVPRRHRVSKLEAMLLLKQLFGVEIVGE
ncbi:50S ribosomal protein L5 [Desulfurococcus mucosus]|uniref:Large ribosomal subunit protein uL5 n=1 Tax=Desulfurococcus mucosus (strain ATCC 35584 / DSM 2162 / JCM 9187 / O7/1) TaxID=765177 RepID=E8RAM7_DESM0|nr:50S ribosomal protein L5 [Desulfurococcus mucosus]ADV65463.1 LSU ribosomal protein L5P [Desulfurococcus mucosus DSM 2162]